jgi:UDP-N-acetylmuramate dehydrogenase
MKISDRPVLSACSTLKLGGTGLAEVSLESEADFEALPGILARLGGNPMVLGQGSNVLFSDGEFPLVLVRVPRSRNPLVMGSSENGVLLRVAGGMRLPGLLGWASNRGLTGLENLAGIPGSIGGAVAMNAGSFGREFGDVVRRVRLWTPDRGLFWVEKEACEWGYRRFYVPQMPGWFIVTEVELELFHVDRNLVRELMTQTYERKKKSQPVSAWTCGCVFKNPPEDHPAGWLLEQAGFRGRRLGGVGLSEMHANFLVHYGEGTASQALELLNEAKQAVTKGFGVDLHFEVKVVSCQ